MKKAFTLVEILVVLAITLLLAGILFPVFARAREKGRQATCQSNLKQLALATQLYVADNTGKYPFLFNEFALTPGLPLPNNKLGIGWGVRISDYLKNNEVFHCPSEPNPKSSDPNLPHIVGDAAFTDYGYNIGLSDVSETKLALPARTVLFDDNEPGQAWNIANRPEITKPFFIRHSGGMNCAFIDGHVKWLPFGSIYAGGLNSDVDILCKLSPDPATFCIY